MKLCQKCNKINVDDAKTCRYCGEPLMSEIPYGFKIVDDLDDDDNSTPTLTPKKEPALAPTPKREPAPAPTPKRESASAPTPKRESASAPTPKREPASVPTPKRESAPAPTPKKETNTRSIHKDVRCMVYVRPELSGKSVKYAEKINSYSGFDKIKCPKCGSDSITLVSNTQKKGFSSGNACCGYFLLGPIGVLCGSLGSNKTSTTEYWVCGGCGNKFQSNSGNAAKEKIKHQGMLLSNVPDETIDNVEVLYSQSSSELEKIKSHYKKTLKEEYLHNNRLKLYAIVSLAITILAIILALLLYFAFDAGLTASAISFIVAIVAAVVALLLKPSIEKKFASEYFMQAQMDLKEATEINNQLKSIKDAKENLSKLRII